MRHFLALVLAFGLLASPALACEQRASLADIEQEVTCPVCGTPLVVAESPQAERERAFIRDLIERCKNKDQIKAALKEEYGVAVLAVPEDRGVGVMAYAVPAVATLGGLLIVFLGVRRWRRNEQHDETALSPTPEITESERERLDRELLDT